VDVIPQGPTRLLLAALEVPGVSRVHVRPLEVPDKDLLELRLTMNAVGRQEFEPCSNMLPDIYGEVLDDKVVIIRPSSSAGESKILQPYRGVRFPGVLGDVGGSSEARRDWCFWMWRPKARGPRPSRLGLRLLSRSHGQPPHLGGASSCSPLG
jgi:hypothetical protein